MLLSKASSDDRTGSYADLTAIQVEATLAYLAPFARPVPPTATSVLATFARACVLTGWCALDALDQAREEAEALAASILDAPDPRSLDLDPLVLAAHHAMLREAGVKSPSLRAVMDALHADLRALPAQIRTSGRVRHTAALLARSGIGDGPMPPPDVAGDPHGLALAPREDVLEAIDHLWAGAPSSPELEEVLGFIALAEFRDYRIDLGSKIVRWLVSRGVRSEAVRESLAFVQLQRSSKGCYGFLDPFEHLNSTSDEQAESFHVPITANALWALREWKAAQA